MISYITQLDDARKLLLTAFSSEITHYTFMINHNQLKFEFRDKSVLYIFYNKVGEYAYQLLFSSQTLDRVRFDSMDKAWNTTTKPHHFHPKADKKGYDSQMIDDPLIDIPKLIKFITSGELKDPTKRF